MHRIVSRFSWVVVALLVSAASGWAQVRSQGSGLGLLMTRAELRELIEAYDRPAGENPAAANLQPLPQREIALIRSRLIEGDFQIGDQVSLRVQGQQDLTNNFSVVAGPEGVALRLPLIGDVPLRGVLRSEIEGHLRNEIGRFIRDPVVHARAMIRLSVFEGVGQPGFYPVAAEDLLTDVLMAAGGPSAGAQLDKVRIERGKDRIWEGEALQRAITEGRTLDQLNLLAGDRVIVPVRGERGWLTIVQMGALLLTTVVTLTRVF